MSLPKYKTDKKYIETVDDVISGSYVVRQQDDDEHISRTGYLSTIMYKISYSHSPSHPTMLTSMSDGYTSLYKSKEELLQSLLKNNYRYATEEELIRVVAYQKNLVQPEEL